MGLELEAGAAGGRQESPSEFYSRRLAELKLKQAAVQRQEHLLALAKVLAAFGIIALIVWLLTRSEGLPLLAVAVVLLVVLAVLHERLLRAIGYRNRVMRFYEQGLARLDGSWPGHGEAGEQFLDPAHPYARDLDIFGKGSVFELLCTARTQSGERTLAGWLLNPASVEEIRGRQAAVSELRDQVAFRERLSAIAEVVRRGIHPDTLVMWAQGNSVFGSQRLRLATAALALLWIFSLVAWGVWGWGTLALLVSILNFCVTYRLQSRLEVAVEGVERSAQDLKLLAEVLELLERQTFQSPKLAQLRAALDRDGVAPSVAIRRLGKWVESLESHRNPFAKMLDLFLFWSVQLAYLIERWRGEFGPSIRGWLDAVGEIEALAAISGYAYEHPSDVFPEFVEQGPQRHGLQNSEPRFDAVGLAHPLIPESRAVRNDLTLGGEGGLRLVVISGPNMAGKSTFIRGVGVNVVLAQCGAPVRAERLMLSRLNVAASICVLDSLQGGVSRFYAEISRLKLIFDLTGGPAPVLFLLDELLSGTNSHDRFVGTQFVVRGLVERSAIGLVTTHDLALTKIPESMEAAAANFHFADTIENGELKFDYKLSPGVVQTSNALELMRAIGLPVKREDG